MPPLINALRSFPLPSRPPEFPPFCAPPSLFPSSPYSTSSSAFLISPPAFLIPVPALAPGTCLPHNPNVPAHLRVVFPPSACTLPLTSPFSSTCLLLRSRDTTNSPHRLFPQSLRTLPTRARNQCDISDKRVHEEQRAPSLLSTPLAACLSSLFPSSVSVYVSGRGIRSAPSALFPCPRFLCILPSCVSASASALTVLPLSPPLPLFLAATFTPAVLHFLLAVLLALSLSFP
ncbi:hypothetical protein B0H19DRAFT_1250921 [Mycena capillaripes]|nr:hypothetical protein B0H19DRAFT_1250921 [Mycena capillaripes]